MSQYGFPFSPSRLVALFLNWQFLELSKVHEWPAFYMNNAYSTRVSP